MPGRARGDGQRGDGRRPRRARPVARGGDGAEDAPPGARRDAHLHVVVAGQVRQRRAVDLVLAEARQQPQEVQPPQQPNHRRVVVGLGRRRRVVVAPRRRRGVALGRRVGLAPRGRRGLGRRRRGLGRGLGRGRLGALLPALPLGLGPRRARGRRRLRRIRRVRGAAVAEAQEVARGRVRVADRRQRRARLLEEEPQLGGLGRARLRLLQRLGELVVDGAVVEARAAARRLRRGRDPVVHVGPRRRPRVLEALPPAQPRQVVERVRAGREEPRGRVRVVVVQREAERRRARRVLDVDGRAGLEERRDARAVALERRRVEAPEPLAGHRRVRVRAAAEERRERLRPPGGGRRVGGRRGVVRRRAVAAQLVAEGRGAVVVEEAVAGDGEQARLALAVPRAPDGPVLVRPRVGEQAPRDGDLGPPVLFLGSAGEAAREGRVAPARAPRRQRREERRRDHI